MRFEFGFTRDIVYAYALTTISEPLAQDLRARLTNLFLNPPLV